MYCVVKGTAKVIDSNNTNEVMLKNAQNAGFAETEVEALTEEEYQARKANEPQQPRIPTEVERISALEEAILVLMG